MLLATETINVPPDESFAQNCGCLGRGWTRQEKAVSISPSDFRLLVSSSTTISCAPLHASTRAAMLSCTGRIWTVQTADYCRIGGASDSYGLGIRLGTYLVWVATIIAINVVTHEAERMRNLSTMFQLATAITLFCHTAMYYTLFAIEVPILLALWIGGLATSTHMRIPTSLAKLKSSAYLDVGKLGQFARLGLIIVSAGYGLWYAIPGLDPFCQSLCSNYVFFFAKVDAYGWYRKVLKVVFALYCAGAAVVLVWSLFSKCVSGRRKKDGAQKSEEQRSETKDDILGLIAGTVVMVIFILAIELTIHWNNIVDVNQPNSVGQLFPLIIGILALGKTFKSGLTEPSSTTKQ